MGRSATAKKVVVVVVVVVAVVVIIWVMEHRWCLIIEYNRNTDR